MFCWYMCDEIWIHFPITATGQVVRVLCILLVYLSGLKVDFIYLDLSFNYA